jgi:hypothetical protein
MKTINYKIIQTKRHGLELFVAQIDGKSATFFSQQFAMTWIMKQIQQLAK